MFSNLTQYRTYLKIELAVISQKMDLFTNAFLFLLGELLLSS